MGVYSKKFKSINDLKSGARVALPNDPSNLARALLVLQNAGLIKIKDGVNPARVSELDLAENKHKLKFLPLDAAHLPRALEDADFVVVERQLRHVFGPEADRSRGAGKNARPVPERGGRESR